MTGETKPKIWRWIIAFGLLLIVVAVLWYFLGGGFTRSLRARVISRLEQMTGGRVEMGPVEWSLRHMSVVAHDLTIHGTEPAGSPPYLHVDEVLLDARLNSLFSRTIELNRLVIKHPVVHLWVNADGSTNQPRPEAEGTSSGPAASIFAMQIGELSVTDGEFFFNGQRSQLDLTAQEISAGLRFDGSDRYRGTAAAGELTFRRAKLPAINGKTRVDFLLEKNKLNVDSLHVDSPDGSLEANGSVVEFVHPRLELTYKGWASLPMVAEAIGNEQIRGGRLVLAGTLSGPYDHASAQGTALVSNLEVRHKGVRLAPVNLSASYQANPSELKLSKVRAQLLGGSASGAMKIENWFSDFEDGQKLPQRAEGNFEFAGIQVDRFIAAMPPAPLPVQKLEFRGNASGNLKVEWIGTPSRAVASFKVSVTPPAALSSGSVPLTAEAAGSYGFSGNSLELRNGNASTATMRLEAAGRLSPNATQLRVTASAENSSELQPLFGQAPLAEVPLRPRGSFKFQGSISGKLRAPVVEGSLELGDFTTRVSMLAGEANPRELHWDRFAGQIHYGPESMWVRNGTLRRGPMIARISGEAKLVKGSLVQESVLQAQVSTQNASLTDVQAVFETQYPITGELSAQANITGTRENPQGSGRVEIRNGAVRGEPFQSLTTGFVLSGQMIRANNLVLRKNGGSITGEGSLNRQSKEFQLKIAGQQIHLAEVQTLQRPKLHIGGDLAFQAEGSGTLEHPVLNAKLAANHLKINEREVGAVEASLTTIRREMTVKLRSNFAGGDIAADGNVQLAGDFPVDITAQFQRVDLTPLAAIYMQRELPGTALVAGQGRLTGPLRQPKLLNATIDVSQFQGKVEQITVQNDGPWQLAYQDQALRIKQFHVTGEGTNLTASGGVDLKGKTNLDLHANGQANLQLLRDAIPGLRSYGAATLELAILGTVERPNMSGQIKVSDAGFNFIDLPNGLSEVNGTLVFNENRLQIQQLRARTGGGDIDITGFVAYRRGMYFELGVQGQDIRLRYPEGISSNANATLRLTGTLKNALLAGDVTVTRFTVTPKFDLALYLASSRQPTPTPLGNTMLDNIRLDVHVTTTPELHVETSLAKLSAEADVHVRGNLARPVVLGRVNIVEGDIFFNGTKYHLERGDITFSNPVKTEPVLNVEASARVRSYDITLGFHGSVNKLGTTYRSEPPLPTSDIIALLALGHTRDETDITQQQPTSMTETASNAILGQALNYALSNRVQKLFGVSRIKIDPMVGGPDNASARVTIEQQVNNNVTLTYITNLAQSSQQVIQAEFTFNRDVSLVVVRDQNGVLGFDLRLRQRLK